MSKGVLQLGIYLIFQTHSLQDDIFWVVMQSCSVHFTSISYEHSACILSVKGYITWCHIPQGNSLTVATMGTLNITHSYFIPFKAYLL